MTKWFKFQAGLIAGSSSSCVRDNHLRREVPNTFDTEFRVLFIKYSVDTIPGGAKVTVNWNINDLSSSWALVKWEAMPLPEVLHFLGKTSFRKKSSPEQPASQMMAERAYVIEVSNIPHRHKKTKFLTEWPLYLKWEWIRETTFYSFMSGRRTELSSNEGAGLSVRMRVVTVTIRNKISKLFINHLSSRSRRADNVTSSNKLKA